MTFNKPQHNKPRENVMQGECQHLNVQFYDIKGVPTPHGGKETLFPPVPFSLCTDCRQAMPITGQESTRRWERLTEVEITEIGEQLHAMGYHY